MRKNENIDYRVLQNLFLSSTMPGRGRPTSPWWTHFQIVDGDFRLVQCIHCNKMVRRGKAGCSSKETSNSGMATHMRAKHRDLANQVVHFNMDEASIELTTSRCRLHWIWQERAAHSQSTRRTRQSAVLCPCSNCDPRLIEKSGRNW